jgi:hypothetical protein
MFYSFQRVLENLSLSRNMIVIHELETFQKVLLDHERTKAWATWQRSHSYRFSRTKFLLKIIQNLDQWELHVNKQSKKILFLEASSFKRSVNKVKRRRILLRKTFNDSSRFANYWQFASGMFILLKLSVINR